MQCAFPARYSGCGFRRARVVFLLFASALFSGVVVSLSLSSSPLSFEAAAIFISLSFLRKRRGGEKKQSKKQTLSRFLISLFLSVARPSLPSGSQKNQKRLRAAAMRRYIISDTACREGGWSEARGASHMFPHSHSSLKALKVKKRRISLGYSQGFSVLPIRRPKGMGI